MATEVLVGLIGFGTAVVGLATAYVSRSRQVVHRHELAATPNADVRPQPVSATEIELDLDEPEAHACGSTSTAPGSRDAGDNKYALAAVKAVELCRASASRQTPPQAWDAATEELFGVGTPAQRKGCPKGTFLGLCQAGYVVGVPRGDYTRSDKNQGYALAAVELLDREPDLAADWRQLWERVPGTTAKQHNSQMHVVIALWRRGLVRNPSSSSAKV